MTLSLKMEQSIAANGWAPSSMGMESKSGLMELATKVIGAKIKLVDKANSGTLMVTCLKESGLTIKLKAMEFTHMLMVLKMVQALGQYQKYHIIDFLGQTFALQNH